MDLQKGTSTKFFHTLVGYFIVIGTIALLTGAILFFQRPPENPGKHAEDIKENVLYKVISVLDGDTLIANVSGHEVTIRMIGIDTPEVVDPRKPVQCYGPEASVHSKELLIGRSIYIEKDKIKEATVGNYDNYGRVLAYVRLKNGELYNEKMIEEGFAREYTFGKEKYQYQKKFKATQTKAKKEKVGLWGACTI